MSAALTILTGDCRETLKTIESGTVHACITSPPYWGLRSYLPTGHDDKHREIGSEPTPDAYVQTMVEVFREVRRVMHDSATLWLNLGDTMTDKCCAMIPERVALALIADGWLLRSKIVWAKKSCMPESVGDRPTNSWEPIFLLAKSSSYFYDAEAVKEPSEAATLERGKHAWNGKVVIDDDGKERRAQPDATDKMGDRWCAPTRNQRNVWHLGPEPFTDSTKTVVWNRVREGALSGDMRRIALPDSQFDGGLFDLLATVLCDEHADASLSHIADICPHLSLKPAPGFVPFATLRAYKIGDESLDSLLLNSWPSAISRSSESHKTGLFVSTTIACMPSAERTARIARILAQRGLSALYLDSLVSNTWPDEMDARSWEGTLCRSGDIVSFSCEPVYRKASKMQSHFAVFPTEIPRRAILAGTSARGCCPKCFAPWVRVVEKPKLPGVEAANHAESGRMKSGGVISTTRKVGGQYQKLLDENPAKTVGWEPSCSCKQCDNCGHEYRKGCCDEEDSIGIPFPPIPCAVLDPFGGSGTTGQVALELGRNAILCELSPDYAKLIETRTNVTPGLPGLA